MADKDAEKTPKESFVSQADRPDVNLKADTPLSELRVRDLASLLAQVGGTRKDFWNGKSWQKDDFDGPIVKGWKEGKEFKDKDKEKEKEKEKEKDTTREARIQETAGKAELDGVFEADVLPGPDPRLDQVIQALSGLTSHRGSPSSPTRSRS